jgi:electron transport complex protein RnfD
MTGNGLYEILAGGLMIGAFFMATDYTTSPLTPKGQIIFGIGCGVITSVIRIYGGYPEGVSYSILLMNLCVPLIDKYTAPRVFGTGGVK